VTSEFTDKMTAFYASAMKVSKIIPPPKKKISLVALAPLYRFHNAASRLDQ